VLADAGTLVSDDAQALAAALERVLASPVGLGLRGRAVAKNYDGAAVGARLMDLYAEVIERRAKRPTSFAVVRPG
jgi:glycosyltransferase involved in cell wall biosynthesis